MQWGNLTPEKLPVNVVFGTAFSNTSYFITFHSTGAYSNRSYDDVFRSETSCSVSPSINNGTSYVPTAWFAIGI